MINRKYSNLVFLIYRSRSGSTFFAERLGKHPDVLVTPESRVGHRLYNFFRQDSEMGRGITIQEVVEYIYDEKKFRDWELPREKLVDELKGVELKWDQIFGSICEAYRKWKKPRANIVVFKKSGWYARKIAMLLNTFPNSLAIAVVRDPRAVYNSARKALHSETNEPMAENIIKNAFGWKEFISKVISAKKKYSGRVLFVQYESMLENLEKVLLNSWFFLETKSLDEKEINKYLSSESDSHLVTNSTEHLHKNIHKAPIKSFADKWKNELPVWKRWLIKVICWSEMTRFNYK